MFGPQSRCSVLPACASHTQAGAEAAGTLPGQKQAQGTGASDEPEPAGGGGRTWTEPRVKGMNPWEAIEGGSPRLEWGLPESSAVAAEGLFNRGLSNAWKVWRS